MARNDADRAVEQLEVLDRDNNLLYGHIDSNAQRNVETLGVVRFGADVQK
jgi:hypothetical protein